MICRARRWGLGAAIAVAVLLVLPVIAWYAILWASLPKVDGRITVHGIEAPVTIERDARGIVTITASTRKDLAFGTGYVHGEDRFFQMDLARRLAAGELSALVGPAALAQDRRTRLFRFRAVARRALARTSPRRRALLEAYARGVNAGLASLPSRPWTYWLLRARPKPWSPVDSFLVVYAMWWQLQSGDLERARLRRTLDARLGGPECGLWKCALAFLYPARTAWDAPNVPDQAALRAEDARDARPPSIPGPDALDVRAPTRLRGVVIDDPDPRREDADVGSNAWALSGRFTATGSALVASDMHLPLAVPPTWYRARLRISGPGVPPASRLDLNGLTLPGAPGLVAGSNGDVAWAFTNSDGDWLDALPVTCLSVGRSAMPTPAGDVPLKTVIERIRVRGGPDARLPVVTGPQGVLFAIDPAQHRCWFASWLAEVPSATNLNLLAFERATSVKQVLALAPSVGIPQQNLIVADRAGHIGWTLAGRVPIQTGAGRMTAPKWRTAADMPRLYDPPLGRLWSANARATSDPQALEAIGGADAPVGAQYVLGARARQIRNALLALGRPVRERQMLRIQLDDRALFLARWRRVILELLDRQALARHPRRAEFRRLVASWDARADVRSVGYRLVRTFHDAMAAAVWRMILTALDVRTNEPPPLQFERPLWALITRRPLHMLAARYPSWRALLMSELDRTIARLRARCGSLARCRWGAAHPVVIRQPLGRAFALLAPFVDYPRLELPGDRDMPRVQRGAFGASERFAISPGHESSAYLHVPGGESGDPLSPYYRGGLGAWADGRALPLLPGAPDHRLVLQPARGAVNSPVMSPSRPGMERDRLRPGG